MGKLLHMMPKNDQDAYIFYFFRILYGKFYYSKQSYKKKSMASTDEIQPIEVTFLQFVDFLRSNLNDLDHSGGVGISSDFPEFDLMPQNYLAYANIALSDSSDANRINCISHLKRAVECEADTFFHVLQISRRLNFPQKLEALERLELMPSRSIVHLNRIRNKVEHEYSVPEIDDLSVYFDLVAGFIAAIEGAIYMLISIGGLMEWDAQEENSNLRFSIGLDISYSTQTSSITVYMYEGKACSHYKVSPDNWDAFLDTLRILFLLIRGASVISKDYVISLLPAIPAI